MGHLLFLILQLICCASGQLNRPPQFVSGGDMARFSLPEDAPLGAPVYQLRGTDPEGSSVHYSISGTFFTVDRGSGVVTLAKPLDREKTDLIEVIISITDEGVAGSEPNTVSLRREVPVLDVNDNAPVFRGRPYSFAIPETAPVGTVVFKNVTISDGDLGNNAELELSCIGDGQETCKMFEIITQKVSEGEYLGVITLKQTLDYERQSAYSLVVQAVDHATDPKSRLSATANIAIDVLDVQDQPPIFLGAPYSATVPEGSPPGTSVLKVRAQDGDSGAPRPVLLEVEGDNLGYFELLSHGNGEADLITSELKLDRENPEILEGGGIYTFLIKATELINGELPGDTATSQVTVVVTDMDDQLPIFNRPSFKLTVPEDIGADTPLPGLGMVVNDEDVGENARFSLSLRGVQNFPLGVFTVHPVSAQGRTPVVVRVIEPNKLDYDIENEEKRRIVFDVVASVKRKEVEENIEVSSSQVTIDLVDANDNAPVFPSKAYRLRVHEDASPGLLINNISATDNDSGNFGHITYSIRGFGAATFYTDPNSGGIFLANGSQGLDYETQKSYSLTFEARDGGGRVSAANLFVEVEDVNDNPPIFEHTEYKRTIREGATNFEPQLYVRATDADGPEQGGGKIFYSIQSSNTPDLFFIEPVSGEVKLNGPAKASDTQLGQYDVVVRATDAGSPPLHNDVKVLIRVGVHGNQRPVFLGHHNIGENAPAGYNAEIRETSLPGSNVVKVIATDPDGQDSLLQYFIAGGAKDNFLINKKTGEITVSPDARLDLDTGLQHYDVIVHAVDSGVPVRETATATVVINIIDVNNKPPKFPNNSASAYVQYISERTPVGTPVLTVEATDPDHGAQITYSIVDPVKAIDKTGVAVRPESTTYNFQSAFSISNSTGVVSVSNTLDHEAAAVIILTVEARDIQAEERKELQVARTEVTLYIQAHSDSNPLFTVAGWTPTNPVIKVNVPEEQPIGTTILMLSARDPVTGGPIFKFEEMDSAALKDTEDFVSVGLQSGNVVLNKRLDYETMNQKILKFQVRAIADVDRFSVATISLEVEDINDNTPQFTRKDYFAKISESSHHPESILTVEAKDGDSFIGSEGFGTIIYSLAGESANLFTIDPSAGVIRIAENATLDRERQSVLRFAVVASDTPEGGINQRRSTASVTVEVLDVNDNAPQFNKRLYSAVVPENVQPGTSVLTLFASDPDESDGGEVNYEILDESEAIGLFVINQTTGEIKTKRQLTGKGRTEPYTLIARAQDGGNPPLHTDIQLSIYIGDVFANDGVPVFIRPSLDEIAYVSENSSLGSPVFQVMAMDPDDPLTPNGKITYRFLSNGADIKAFKIDSETGLITTQSSLDRELQEVYQLLLVVQDGGSPPQQATRLLKVQVLDVDDHKPLFQRNLDDEPLLFSVEEEIEIGTEVGLIEAIDKDINENALIDYRITNGNEGGIFAINRTSDNKGIITVANRIDREEIAEHILTVKCFKKSTKPQSLKKPYNRQDPSEIKVKIKVEDIDDNRPSFSFNNVTIGVRLNVPIDTSLLFLEATDIDASAQAVIYNLVNSTFVSLAPSTLDVVSVQTDGNTTFRLDEKTGELRTAGSMLAFVDGYFELLVNANNSVQPDWQAEAVVKVFVLRDRDLLRFVFSRPPNVVRRILPEFQHAVEKALLLPLSVNVYDTQFYSKDDGSLDFSSTSSCFQLVGKESYDLKDMESLLQDPENMELEQVYNQYGVEAVERCAPVIAKAEASWTQLWVLAIASFVGLAAFVTVIVTCCLYSRYKRNTRNNFLSLSRTVPGAYLTGSNAGGPPTIILGPPSHPEWSAHDNLSYNSLPNR